MTPAEAYLAQESVAPNCRWSARRKAEFLTALAKWPEESDALLESYGVSADEVVEWQRSLSLDGMKGLRARQIMPSHLRWKPQLDPTTRPSHHRRVDRGADAANRNPRREA